jgi:hypothetical protein
MCTVSMVADHYQDKWRHIYDQYTSPTYVGPTRAEFDALKKEVEDLKALLKRAKEYDVRNNEPDCEIAEKMEVLRKIAQLVGISLDDVIQPKQ